MRLSCALILSSMEFKMTDSPDLCLSRFGNDRLQNVSSPATPPERRLVIRVLPLEPCAERERRGRRARKVYLMPTPHDLHVMPQFGRVLLSDLPRVALISTVRTGQRAPFTPDAPFHRCNSHRAVVVARLAEHRVTLRRCRLQHGGVEAIEQGYLVAWHVAIPLVKGSESPVEPRFFS